MRPPAIEKMGYYPTDEPVLEILKTYIQPAAARGRLLDPCAGEGQAAAVMGQTLNCETWGAELSYQRHALAAGVMDLVHQAPWQACQLTDESITLLFLNPPYENDRYGDGKRLELAFLKSTTPKLARGGLLVYIVPQHILDNTETARYLAGHYEQMTVQRFPGDLFAKFKQVAVLAYRRKSYKLPSNEEVAAIQSLAAADLPELENQETPQYTLLPAPERGAHGRAILFKRTDYEPEEVAGAALQTGVHRTAAWLDLIHPNRSSVSLTRPVMPLKRGHIAMLMASGLMGTVRLLDENGSPMLIKGRVVKVVDKTEESDPDNAGVTIEKYRDRFVTTVAVLRQSGIEIIQDVKGLADFMKAHGDEIASHVLQTYYPRYNLDPTPAETAALDQIGRDRKPLPGQTNAGLLPAQRHAAAAMARAIKSHGVGNLQGEMGLGKTTIGAAVIELLDAYPALIICPPHLAPKWQREIEEVIPNAHARELRRIGRASGEAADVNDVRCFLDEYEQALQHAQKTGQDRPKWVAIVANTSAKMGSGWQPAVTMRYTTHPLTGKPALACACPNCGQVIRREQDGILLPITDMEELKGKRQFCRHLLPGWALDEHNRRKLDENGEPIWGLHPCNTPLFQFNGTRRHAIADYISKHAKGRFKLLVADEVHMFKSKSSDRGIAFHQLVTASKYTLTLTGTFFGGKSTSIFWLLHRLNAGVRRDFGFNEETRWARLYGVIETIRRKHRSEDDGDGVFTGNRRYRNQAKEQPGVSPAVISRLLDTTVFLSLKDLGLALPDYNEEVVLLEMLDEQESQYTDMEDMLKQLAKQSNRYLSTWLQWSLARPNSAFRDEVVLVDEVQEDGKTVRSVPLLELPAVVGAKAWLPKESWLADYCSSEKRQGRKTLVYVRQTGTRDIQDHLVEPLRSAGLRAAILSGGVNPRKREAWINDRAAGLDVLVCNPRLVETGLDLVQFSTVIFAEIEYSLYTLWQAVRRVWRLGQTNPVKALFSVYNGTMEASALSVMGRKMKAAQLLYGDEVGGAIVPEEEGDFLTQLARDVLHNARLDDLQTLFADDNRISHSPLGCPTQPSASSPVIEVSMLSWEEWAAMRSLSPKNSRHRQQHMEGQMRLL